MHRTTAQTYEVLQYVFKPKHDSPWGLRGLQKATKQVDISSRTKYQTNYSIESNRTPAV